MFTNLIKLSLAILVILSFAHSASALEYGHVVIKCQPGYDIFLDEELINKSSMNNEDLLIKAVPVGEHVFRVVSNSVELAVMPVKIEEGHLMVLDPLNYDEKQKLIKHDDFVPVEQMPSMISSVEPTYPEKLKNENISGDVMVKALINKEGDVVCAMVCNSKGPKPFDDEALFAAYKNKYKPALQNNQPVAVWISYKVTFTLEDSEK